MEIEAMDALEVLACIAEDLEESEDYEKARALKAGEIETEEEVLREFGRSLQPASLEAMQDVFYRLTLAKQFQRSTAAAVGVRVYLSSAWHEIGPWRK